MSAGKGSEIRLNSEQIDRLCKVNTRFFLDILPQLLVVLPQAELDQLARRFSELASTPELPVEFDQHATAGLIVAAAHYAIRHAKMHASFKEAFPNEPSLPALRDEKHQRDWESKHQRNWEIMARRNFVSDVALLWRACGGEGPYHEPIRNTAYNPFAPIRRSFSVHGLRLARTGSYYSSIEVGYISPLIKLLKWLAWLVGEESPSDSALHEDLRVTTGRETRRGGKRSRKRKPRNQHRHRPPVAT